jgi:hypothetical protein
VAKACESLRPIFIDNPTIYKDFSVGRRSAAKAGDGGALRLLDVKPPCSNLAEPSGSANFFSWNAGAWDTTACHGSDNSSAPPQFKLIDYGSISQLLIPAKAGTHLDHGYRPSPV